MNSGHQEATILHLAPAARDQPQGFFSEKQSFTECSCGKAPTNGQPPDLWKAERLAGWKGCCLGSKESYGCLPTCPGLPAQLRCLSQLPHQEWPLPFYDPSPSSGLQEPRVSHALMREVPCRGREEWLPGTGSPRTRLTLGSW